MSVPFEKLLEGVARELAHEVRFSENFQPSAEVILKRHLLPLLQAGQAMRDNTDYHDGKYAESGCEQCKACVAWDAERERLAGLGGGK